MIVSTKWPFTASFSYFKSNSLIPRNGCSTVGTLCIMVVSLKWPFTASFSYFTSNYLIPRNGCSTVGTLCIMVVSFKWPFTASFIIRVFSIMMKIIQISNYVIRSMVTPLGQNHIICCNNVVIIYFKLHGC